jgi:hypothetical protein
MNDEEAMPEQGPRQWLAVGQVLVLTLLSGDQNLGSSHLARTQLLLSAWADKILLFSLLLKIVGIEPIILYYSFNLERRLSYTHMPRRYESQNLCQYVCMYCTRSTYCTVSMYVPASFQQKQLYFIFGYYEANINEIFSHPLKIV